MEWFYLMLGFILGSAVGWVGFVVMLGKYVGWRERREEETSEHETEFVN